jgi:hypothetical protein
MANLDRIEDRIMGIILDYIDLDLDSWKDFKKSYRRAYMKVGVYNDPTIEKMTNYVENQCRGILAILVAIKGEKWLFSMLQRGLNQVIENPKYSTIIHEYNIGSGSIDFGTNLYGIEEH